MSYGPSLFGAERWAATELAEALCLSTQRINQLVKEGILPSPIEGRYAPREAVSRYVQHIRQREERQSHAGEAVRKLQLENQTRQIKLQKIAGALVPAERVAKDWFEVTRRIRDTLLNLPARLSGPFAAESDQRKIFDEFTREIFQVLTELSTRQAPAPVAGRLPLGVAPEPKQSTDQTEAMDEAGEHDVQDPEELDGESNQQGDS